MAAHVLTACQWVLLAGCTGASLYAMLAAVAMPFYASRRSVAASPAQDALRASSALYPFAYVGVSVLKPLCGAEPRLYENLRTFCEQRHGYFQLVLGVSSPDDPAIAVVRRLQAAYPTHDIELAIDTRVHGSNLKVSNLINMAERARHEVIVIADSDIAVEADYLDSVAAPLADPRVGVVTCLYVAQGVGGFWPRVGALFINEWFAPSVRVAHAAGSRRFGFGATLALRRATLERIGGFEALKNCLADDYWLAEHVRALGLRTVLSRVMVATDVIEPTFYALWQRETRWLRTIRSVNPLGFAFLFITFPTPWLLTGAWLTAGLAASASDALHAWAALTSATGTATGLAARLLMHLRAARHERTFWRDLPLVPLRDALLALQWLAGAFGSHVVWRGARVPVGSSTPMAAHKGALNVMDVVEASDGN
ncbi:hopanoid biosynthesis associated glycosyl transferase protein HpnI [Burkholderia sp. Ch1-1]|uniref:Hopanoid biosynthesis associated glycosyl transferase protein HpnI n=1 Tax=Paraburkholderia dioscoreae TaxID=2604047 RepID=A0A5Q4YT92_9BURK|nr:MULTISPECIES: bacteriohopanetetrol glucosamine biosynthesis glycosyltransferase HpnI [Paraburkholderia]EIF31080.1 hopanoid biosynthesis associated glycosyl transferase protein HpnI [Burkholderia sp. Ch1-1]MDR8401113.1 bacteriohopanetetrol glucosamine biosynthesis glycosyltransferase HpnI [Paraburkholderia sp. USG1]VVD28729.1 Hopanoid biosynthesis associated glycosyl transferase protein HpnI [Paraburkholderia dioscoreae]